MPATVRFVDIAGLVRGASQGQGLGNQFLAHIRETDAICQVVRVFTDPDVSHVDGDVSPERDIETIATELILADLQTLEKAVPRLVKEARAAKDAATNRGGRCRRHRRSRCSTAGPPCSPAPPRPASTSTQLRELSLLTAKPFVYVFNVDDAELADDALQDRLAKLVAPAESVFLDAKVEAELADLPPAEAAELLAELGLGEPAWTSWPGPASRRSGWPRS